MRSGYSRTDTRSMRSALRRRRTPAPGLAQRCGLRSGSSAWGSGALASSVGRRRRSPGQIRLGSSRTCPSGACAPRLSGIPRPTDWGPQAAARRCWRVCRRTAPYTTTRQHRSRCPASVLGLARSSLAGSLHGGSALSVRLHSPDIRVEQPCLLLTVAVEPLGDRPQAIARLHVVQQLVVASSWSASILSSPLNRAESPNFGFTGPYFTLDESCADRA